MTKKIQVPEAEYKQDKRNKVRLLKIKEIVELVGGNLKLIKNITSQIKKDEKNTRSQKSNA